MVRQMTFAALRDDTGVGLGIKTERGMLDVRRAAAQFRVQVPATPDDLVRGQGDGAALQRLVEVALSAKTADELFVPEAQAQFGPCVANPGKIVCVGLNYARHAAETKAPLPVVPILFNKYNNSLLHHDGAINVSGLPAEKFDYEAELVIVMGRTARNVTEAQALSYVFGYCVGNDFSARDLQLQTTQWMVGKTSDGFAPIGPYLVSADQVPDPNRLDIECRVNGEVRQSSNTKDMIFSCAQIIAYVSRHFPLDPGDIIFTGTPEGVILGYPKEKRVWLRPGDRVETRIEGLGTLRFSLV